jgi:two-component system, chemotaxis family, response regulator Rcp1
MSVRTKLVQVLLIEDSAGDALLTGQIVAESRVPIKLVIARDGVQALSMLDDPSFEPALIILDLNIPIISGHAVLERNPRKDIPVVIFSVSDDQRDMQRALALGAREYVQKPMNLEAYKKAVLGIIEKWVRPENNGAEGAAAS